MKKLLLAVVVFTYLPLISASAQEDELPLIKQIEQLVVEKNYVQKKLEETQRERDALKISLDSFKDKAKAKNGTSDSAYEDLLLQKNSLIRQITNIRQEKVILQQKIKNLEQKLKLQTVNNALDQGDGTTELEAEIDDISQKYSRAVQTVDQITKTNENLRSKVTELEARLEKEKRDAGLRLSTKNDSTEAKIKEYEAKISSLTKELNSAKLAQSTLENDLTIAENQVDKYARENSQDVSRLQSEIEMLEQKYASTIDRLKKSHQLELDNLNNQIAALNATKNDFISKSKDVEKADEQLKIAQMTNVNLRDEITYLKDKIKAHERTINVTMKAEAQQFKQTISELQGIIEENQLKNLEAIQNAKDPLIEKISSLTRSRDDLEEEAVRLKRQLNAIETSANQERENLETALNNQLTAKVNKISELETKIAAITSKKEELESTNRTQAMQLKDLENDLVVANTKIESLNQTQSAKNQSINELTTQLSDSQNIVTELTSKLENNINELQKIKENNKELKSIKNNQEKELIRNDDRMASLNKTIGKLEADLEKIRSEKLEALAKIKETSNKLDASVDNVQQLTEQVELLTSAKQDLDKKLKLTQDAITDKNAIIANLNEEINAKESTITSQRDEIAQLNIENKNNLSEIKTILEEKSDLTKTISNLNGELAVIGADIEQKISVAKAPLEAEISDLKKQSVVQEQQIAERDRTIDWLDGKNKTINDLFSQSEQSNALLRKENTAYAEEVAKLKQMAEDRILEAQKSHKKEIVGLNNRIATLIEESEKNLNKQAAEYRKELAAASSETTKKEELLVQSNQKYEELLALKQAQASELNDQQLANNKLRNSVYDLELKVSTLEEATAKDAQKIAQTEEELANLSSTISTQKSIIEDLTEKKNEQLAEVETLSTEKLDLKQSVEKLQGLLASANELVENQQSELAKKSEDIAKLTKSLELVQQSKGEMTVKNDSLSSGLTELREQYKQLQDRHVVELENTRTPLQHKIKELEDEIIGLTHNNQDYVDTIENLKQEITNYRSELLNVKSEKSELQQEYILAAKKLEQIETKVPDHIAEAKMPLEASIKFLERRLLQVEQQKEELETKIQTLEAKSK